MLPLVIIAYWSPLAAFFVGLGMLLQLTLERAP